MMASSPSLIQLPESKQSLNLSGVCTTRVIRLGVEVLWSGEMPIPEIDEITIGKNEPADAPREDLVSTF